MLQGSDSNPDVYNSLKGHLIDSGINGIHYQFYLPFVHVDKGEGVKCPRLSTWGGWGVKFGPCSCWMAPKARIFWFFFSGSRSRSQNCHQKVIKWQLFFIQNDDWEKNEVVLVKTLLFWTKKVVILWLLMTTWETEKQRSRNSGPKESKKKNQFLFTLLQRTTHLWSY